MVLIRWTAVAAVAGALPVIFALPASADEAPEVPGLVVYASEYDVEETARRVEDALSANGMVTATVDHQANAESVGA
ncbi:hypothetical protein BH23ACT2_BH23ACT2_21170 [soil metagenome]